MVAMHSCDHQSGEKKYFSSTFGEDAFFRGCAVFSASTKLSLLSMQSPLQNVQDFIQSYIHEVGSYVIKKVTM